MRGTSVSPLLKKTSKLVLECLNTPYADVANDGIFASVECKHKLGNNFRHALTFEADLINMLGLGNVPPENLSAFLRDFLINREN